jgi:hypothetical protein
MKEKNIWFFGDSTTYCHGLRYGFDYYDDSPEIRKPLWTQILSKYFQAVAINYAVCGASNEDIKFRLITQLSNIKEGDVVIIQTTYPTRINIFTNDGEYKPIHMAFGEEFLLKGRVSDEQIETLNNYTRDFLVDNTDRYEYRDMIYFESLKRELELRGVTVIKWQHTLLDEKIRKHMGWLTIKEESDGEYTDEHLGFTAQEPFANLLIEEFEKDNTFVNPDPMFHSDISKLSFNFHEPLLIMKKLYEKVGRRDLCKEYNEIYVREFEKFK